MARGTGVFSHGKEFVMHRGELQGSEWNGAKIRAVGDGLCPEGTGGFSPGFQPWEIPINVCIALL